MGQFSGTRDDEVMMFRCGSQGRPGCGKILTEGQVYDYFGCPRCGNKGITEFSPQTKFGLFMCYVQLLLRGELWVRNSNQANS